MSFEYELRNYRCFPDECFARITVRPGFTSFVGINNAGKSTLLRSLYEFRSFFVALSNPSDAYLNEAQGLPLHGVGDTEAIFSDTNERPISLTVRLDSVEKPSGLPVPSALTFSVRRSDLLVGVEVTLGGEQFQSRSWVSYGSSVTVLEVGAQTPVDLRPYFEAFQLLADTLYIGPFRNALNVGAGDPYYDLEVGQRFIAQWAALKVGQSKETRRAAIQVEEELQRIFDLPNFELNASTDGQQLLVRIGAESYALHEQGAGLAQFILVLARSATQRARLILIDEPELNLHPALQLDFLNTLAAFAPFGVMFATHSIGLARAASDEIYLVRRVAQGKGKVQSLEGTPALAEFMGELSLSGYKELGYSTVLLVEGPTELRTIQRLLRPYRIEHKVVLVPLGGGSMIRPDVSEALLEIKRLTEPVYALIDSERVNADSELDRDRAGFVTSCEAAGVDCHVLVRRAIENYFPKHAVREALGDSFDSLGPYDKLAESTKPWGKQNNWRIADMMTREDIEETDLGEFLCRIKAAVAD